MRIPAVDGANAVLAFVLELVVYAAAGCWGFTRHRTWPARLGFGLGAPLLLITVWALFGAPTAVHPVHGWGRAVLEVCWYGAGAAALAARVGRRGAGVFGAVFLISTALSNL